MADLQLSVFNGPKWVVMATCMATFSFFSYRVFKVDLSLHQLRSRMGRLNCRPDGIHSVCLSRQRQRRLSAAARRGSRRHRPQSGKRLYKLAGQARDPSHTQWLHCERIDAVSWRPMWPESSTDGIDCQRRKILGDILSSEIDDQNVEWWSWRISALLVVYLFYIE